MNESWSISNTLSSTSHIFPIFLTWLLWTFGYVSYLFSKPQLCCRKMHQDDSYYDHGKWQSFHQSPIPILAYTGFVSNHTWSRTPFSRVYNPIPSRIVTFIIWQIWKWLSNLLPFLEIPCSSEWSLQSIIGYPCHLQVQLGQCFLQRKHILPFLPSAWLKSILKNKDNKLIILAHEIQFFPFLCICLLKEKLDGQKSTYLWLGPTFDLNLCVPTKLQLSCYSGKDQDVSNFFWIC